MFFVNMQTQVLKSFSELNLKKLRRLKWNKLPPAISIYQRDYCVFQRSPSKDDNDGGAQILLRSFNIQLKHNFRRTEFYQRLSFKTIKSPNVRKSLLGSISSKFQLSEGRFMIGRKKNEIDKKVEQNENMRILLSDKNLNDEARQKLKVAFYEGFVIDSGKTKQKVDWGKVFIFFLPLGLSVLIIYSILRDRLRSFFTFSIHEVDPEDISVSFADVKGLAEAKEELLEVVEYLKNPEKFSSLGGRLPKGVLLVGPPGTGKTLLARAVAGEANVPFFHASGSEFDEVFVGQGAKRMRNLFSAAKFSAPCVIFIDEIDSAGSKRSNAGIYPYANQTINQLLTEMDGFKKNEGVIVLGATNRAEALDKALRRPGRFDVEVQVTYPSYDERIEILDLYLQKIKTAPDVSVEKLALRTRQFTGAHLENVVNQAALKASTDNAVAVTMDYLYSAIDKVIMGAQRKSRLPDEETNKLTAYCVAGRALVSIYTQHSDPIHKVTITKQGQFVGHTSYMPLKEQYHVNKAQVFAKIDTLMGGRAAEELIFGAENLTKGSSSELKEATNIASSAVKEWGMSEKVGLRNFSVDSETSKIGQTTAEVIDSEIKQILNDSYERAKSILRSKKAEHKMVAEALLKYETLDSDDLKKLISEVSV